MEITANQTSDENQPFPHLKRKTDNSDNIYKQKEMVERIKRRVLEEAREYGNRQGSIEYKKVR